jgi:bacterial leucyl aminopeptidase
MMSYFSRGLVSLLFIGVANVEAQVPDRTSEAIWVTMEEHVYSALNVEKKSKALNMKTYKKNQGQFLLETTTEALDSLGHDVHETFHKCGGFFAHPTKEDAEQFLQEQSFGLAKARLDEVFPEITVGEEQKSFVQSLLEEVSEEEIRKRIIVLSSFKNRYYQSQYGVDSMNLIKSWWTDLTKHRSDASVVMFNHKSFKQPSVVLTIEGRSASEEIIVLGGHGDSIVNQLFNRNEMGAPGADDNASGIATLTEVLRVLMNNNYIPERTLKFMAYAGEETGLNGSKEISRFARDEKWNVRGVLQFDMTNYQGKSPFDIILISDYTSAKQNVFLGNLIDTYLKVPWKYSKCGYACSDHASWTSFGFPASFPFETLFNESNPHIHSKQDVIEKSFNRADHALAFAALGLAYVVELDRDSF